MRGRKTRQCSRVPSLLGEIEMVPLCFILSRGLKITKTLYCCLGELDSLGFWFGFRLPEFSVMSLPVFLFARLIP